MMRAVLVGLGLLMISGAATAQRGNPLDALAGTVGSDAGKLVQLGDLYVEARRLDDAKKTYNQALKAQPAFGEAEFGLVRIDMVGGKFDQSKNGCRGVSRRHKDGSVGDVCSGWFWLSFDRSARAVEEFQKAVDKGDKARGQTGLAEAYLRQGDYDKAVDAYRAALQAGADYVADVGLGLALEVKQDKTGALAAFKTAVGRQPASCLAHFNYGRLLGAGPEAVSELNTAIAIRANWGEAYQALGDVMLAMNNVAGAEGAFRKAIEAEPGRGTAFLGLGRALLSQNKTADAKTALEKAIEIVPNLADAYLLLADIEYASGNTDAALESLDKAKAMAPGEVKVFLHSGEVYYKLQRFTQASSFLNQAITMQPNLSRAFALLGDIACGRRLYDAGQKHYEDALKGDLVGVSRTDIEKRRLACKPQGPAK
ncbi:MAG: tetratricopeptide repeat protein [Deltaproteobacteria bacterium]|nr:tetratricopeptide repeat protein [Deltaproteobacteria bacterium]